MQSRVAAAPRCNNYQASALTCSHVGINSDVSLTRRLNFFLDSVQATEDLSQTRISEQLRSYQEDAISINL